MTHPASIALHSLTALSATFTWYRRDSHSAEIYNGIESSFNARLPNGVRLFGGWTFE